MRPSAVQYVLLISVIGNVPLLSSLSLAPPAMWSSKCCDHPCNRSHSDGMSSSYGHIPLSLFLSFAFYLSLSFSPYSFDIPLRPWPKSVPEQEQPIAVACPLTALVTQVHARGEMQPVHIVVPRRPDPDRRVVDLDESSGDRNWDNGTSVWIHGAKSPHRGNRKIGHAKCFRPC